MATKSVERIQSVLLRIAGYLVPLVQSVPGWMGLMTLPFASYLLLLFTNLPRAISDFFLNLQFFFAPFLIPEKAFVIIGLVILIYSAAYLRKEKGEGLVASGPYGWVRHPQYLGMILTTLGLTSWSVWILNNTFGMGFLSPSQTIGVWFIELCAYILLAYIEELHLSRRHGESFANYKSHVPFFIPFLKTSRKDLEVLVSSLLPTLLLFGLIFGLR